MVNYFLSVFIALESLRLHFTDAGATSFLQVHVSQSALNSGSKGFVAASVT